MEGLSHALSSAATRGSISGITVCSGAPKITHLLFTDDSFLFFKASTQEANVIKDILHRYEALSGQAINLQKSGILFSSNVDSVLITAISVLLNVSKSIEDSHYLGLSSLVGKSKKSVFNYLNDRVCSKIEG